VQLAPCGTLPVVGENNVLVGGRTTTSSSINQHIWEVRVATIITVVVRIINWIDRRLLIIKYFPHVTRRILISAVCVAYWWEFVYNRHNSASNFNGVLGGRTDQMLRSQSYASSSLLRPFLLQRARGVARNWQMGCFYFPSFPYPYFPFSFPSLRSGAPLGREKERRQGRGPLGLVHTPMFKILKNTLIMRISWLHHHRHRFCLATLKKRCKCCISEYAAKSVFGRGVQNSKYGNIGGCHTHDMIYSNISSVNWKCICLNTRSLHCDSYLPLHGHFRCKRWTVWVWTELNRLCMNVSLFSKCMPCLPSSSSSMLHHLAICSSDTAVNLSLCLLSSRTVLTQRWRRCVVYQNVDQPAAPHDQPR